MTKAEVLKIKGRVCKACNKTIEDNREAELHHKTSKTKEYNISDMYNFSDSKIRKELKKCIVLCKSCHTKLHSTYGKKVTIKQTTEFVKSAN